jgi:hypothetical protein
MCLFSVMLCYMSSCAQSSREENHNLIMPVFVDSASFIEDVKADIRFINLYERLRKDNEHASYKYDFNISSTGKIIPKIYEEDALFKSINTFIRSRFNKYKWLAAYEKECPECKKMGYGILYINFIPVNNIIQLRISMSDGAIRKTVYSEMIYDRKIEMP